MAVTQVVIPSNLGQTIKPNHLVANKYDVDAATLVSTDAGNNIVIGTDNKLFISLAIYGTFEITCNLNQLIYTIPFTNNILSFQVTQIENSTGGGYYSDYICKINSGVGIDIIFDVQPPVGQLINFNYFIIN
jgi:hypothetical protein